MNTRHSTAAGPEAAETLHPDPQVDVVTLDTTPSDTEPADVSTKEPQAEEAQPSALTLMKNTFTKFFEDREAALKAKAEKEEEEEKVLPTPDLPLLYFSQAGLDDLRKACEQNTWRVKDDKSGTLRAKWALGGVPLISETHRIPVLLQSPQGEGKEKTLTFTRC